MRRLPGNGPAFLRIRKTDRKNRPAGPFMTAKERRELLDAEEEFVVGREGPDFAVGDGFQTVRRGAERGHDRQDLIMHIAGGFLGRLGGRFRGKSVGKQADAVAEGIDTGAEGGNQRISAGQGQIGGTDRIYRRSQDAGILQDGRQDLAAGHHQHGFRLDVDHFRIGIQADVPA